MKREQKRKKSRRKSGVEKRREEREQNSGAWGIGVNINIKKGGGINRLDRDSSSGEVSSNGIRRNDLTCYSDKRINLTRFYRVMLACIIRSEEDNV